LSVTFRPAAWDDVLFWALNDTKVLGKVFVLLDHIRKDPFQGLGKPEPLKNNLSGWWSRRITGEHRLVYRIQDDLIVVLQCRNHY